MENLSKIETFRLSAEVKAAFRRRLQTEGLSPSEVLQAVADYVASNGSQALMSFLGGVPEASAPLEGITVLSVAASANILDTGMIAGNYIRGKDTLTGEPLICLYYEGYLWTCPAKGRRQLTRATRITKGHWGYAVIANDQPSHRHCIGYYLGTYIGTYRENIAEVLTDLGPDDRDLKKANEAIVNTMAACQANKIWPSFSAQLEKVLDRIGT